MALKLKDRIEADEKASETARAKPKSAPMLEVHHGGATTAKARIGKKATVGHFSEEMHRTIDILRAEKRTTLQAMMGEAWDDFLIKNGKKPFGER
jgi:hypothetical protein